LEDIIPLVKKALSINKEILLLEAVEVKDKKWCEKVLNYQIDSKYINYVTCKDILQGLVESANNILSRIEQEKQNEKLARKQEAEERARLDKELKDLESQLQYEARMKEYEKERELQEKKKQEAEDKLLKEFEDCNRNFCLNFDVKVEDDKICLVGVKDEIPKNLIVPNGIHIIGENAFSDCVGLEKVIVPDNVTKIDDLVFNGCVSLKKIDLSGVTELGKYALSETVVESADLSSATVIGDYAFYNNTVLASVTLNPTGATAGEAAFGYCHSLSDLENEQFLTYVGDYAFAYTALTEADLSAAEYIGQYAFIKEELTKFDITLGNALKELGDNPFALCDTGAFKLENTVSFNGKDYTSPNYNYTISDTVQVIEGSLYQSVPNGLELVTFASDAKTITVAGSTVRIAAMAFAGSGAEQVKLPYTVYSIGHKAFYGCDRLEYVAFTSYNAPVLEEEYDFTYYASGNSLAATGEYAIIGADGKTETTHTGLGIVPYFMWNAVETPSCVYYGAIFLDYIGHIEEPITMVRPINGRNYDSFIFGQYFSSVIDGAAAADPATVRVIDAINALPDTVSLIDKALVAEARRLYDLISTLEQKALVTNYVKLTQAEKRISDLEYLENSGSAVPPDTTIPGNDSNTAGYIVMAVAVIIAVLTPILFLLQKKKKSSSAETPCETEPSEEQHEENT